MLVILLLLVTSPATFSCSPTVWLVQRQWLFLSILPDQLMKTELSQTDDFINNMSSLNAYDVLIQHPGTSPLDDDATVCPKNHQEFSHCPDSTRMQRYNFLFKRYGGHSRICFWQVIPLVLYRLHFKLSSPHSWPCARLI